MQKKETEQKKACFLHFSSHLCLTFRKRSGQSVQPLPSGVLKAGGSPCPALVLFHYHCREYLLDSCLFEEGSPGFVHHHLTLRLGGEVSAAHYTAAGLAWSLPVFYAPSRLSTCHDCKIKGLNSPILPAFSMHMLTSKYD